VFLRLRQQRGRTIAKQFRILHIITRLIIGGAQENTLYSIWGANQHPNFKADLLSGPGLGPEGEITNLCQELQIEPIYLPLSRRNINPLYDLHTLLTYYQVIKKGNYDIVHTHSSKAGILGRLAAKWAGVKVIVHTIHGLPFHPYQNWFFNQFYINLEKRVAPFTDRLICVADAMSEQAFKAGIAPREKFVTIRSGMRLQKFINPTGEREQSRARLGLEPQDIVIGKIARLFHLKGHKYLIEAFAQVARRNPRLRLMFAGDGILLERLQEQARRLGVLEKIIFLGLVSREEIPNAIAMMDIVVHASLREGLARVIPQALAQAKPLISFDVDGAKEVIHNHQTGLLIPPQDVNALTRALEYLLAHPAEAADMGQAGQKLVQQLFEVSTMNEQIVNVYQGLLRQKGLWADEA